jgi:tyrosinase
MRPAWRTLSGDKRKACLEAIKKLKERPEGDVKDPSKINYDQYVKMHWDSVSQAHGLPVFLPWHRKYIHHFELSLKSIDPSVDLPYWDWSLDSQNPEKADIFLSDYLGGTGNKASDNCVDTGVAANWNVKYPSSDARPGSKCLKPEAIATNLNSASSFDQLRVAIEGGSHGAVHQQAGGSCGDMSTMYSPNDPLFFFHHAMVDKIWYTLKLMLGTVGKTNVRHFRQNMMEQMRKLQINYISLSIIFVLTLALKLAPF